MCICLNKKRDKVLFVVQQEMLSNGGCLFFRQHGFIERIYELAIFLESYRELARVRFYVTQASLVHIYCTEYKLEKLFLASGTMTC